MNLHSITQHVLATAPTHPALTLPTEGKASDVVSLGMEAFGITKHTRPESWQQRSVEQMRVSLTEYAVQFDLIDDDTFAPRAVLLDIEEDFSPFRDFANMNACARAAEACRQVWGEQVETWLYSLPWRGEKPGNDANWVRKWFLQGPGRITGIGQSLYVKQNREKTDAPWEDLDARRQDVRTSFELWEGVPLVFVMSHRINGTPMREMSPEGEEDEYEGRLSYVQPSLDCLRVMFEEIKSHGRPPKDWGGAMDEGIESLDILLWDAAPAGTLTDHPNPLIQDAEGLHEALEILFGEEDEDCCEELRSKMAALSKDLASLELSLDGKWNTILDWRKSDAKRLHGLERTLGQRIRGWFRG